ncbi:flagellar hook-associated protein FlgL [Bacillus sp. ISL-45]|uniref:flagellar hook-associated protein FlgL n=1 Tax=Bacillus sp. ISL-45 TaxID=2819128 RepID=UPI001BE8FEA4|nr:flagellar hook-associated protein FlgL [Bacillus sp. ISL-45]MBT2661797.1 flagellar hook-associated protein FlgL [Bacillus sp. ISL-45]
MRITQSMLASNSLKHLSESYRRMGKYEDQLSTGKKITKPSDDPVVAMKGMTYRSNLKEVEQYKRNLSELYLWMDNSEAGIDQANSALQRVRELTIQGMNDSYSQEDRQAIAREVEQLKQSLVATANTQVSGRYIFHGTDVMNPPVPQENPVQVDANMADEDINNYKVEVSRGVFMKANVNPTNVFNQEMFDTVQAIQDELGSANPQKMDELLKDLDKVMNTLSAERSELGARYNRLEMVETRLGEQEVMATKILSDNEDAEIERVIMDLKSQESVHRAALSVGARIIQPTLMDFLR